MSTFAVYAVQNKIIVKRDCEQLFNILITSL